MTQRRVSQVVLEAVETASETERHVSQVVLEAVETATETERHVAQVILEVAYRLTNPPDPEPPSTPAEGDWIYYDQLEAREGGQVLPDVIQTPPADDTTSDTYAFAITPVPNRLMLVFGLTIGDEAPETVAHAGLDAAFGFAAEGQIGWDTGDVPTRITWIWAAETGPAPSADDLVVSFADPMDGCIVVVQYVADYDTTDPIGSFTASRNSDPTVDTLTPQFGVIDAGSFVFCAAGFNNVDGADDAASDGTLVGISTHTAPDVSLAVFAVGSDDAPTVTWNTASEAGVVAIEVHKKKPTPAPNVAPTADLVLTPISGAAPLAVDADASGSSDPEGPIKSYAFAWGDGAVRAASSSPLASHTYADPGTYRVRVTVRDAADAVATDEQVVSVSGTPPTGPPALLTGTLSRDPFGTYGPDGWNPEISWAQLEPTEGVLDTTALDAAIAGGHPIRLRLEVGAGAPSWVKSAVGTVTLMNPQTGRTATCAKWWASGFLTRWDAFVHLLAPEYDETVLGLVFSAACMAIFAEPCIRGFADGSNLSALRAAGLTSVNDVAAQKATTEVLADAFDYARISMAVNPYQLITATSWKTDEPTTLELMTYFRGLWGERFVLQNNSVRDWSQSSAYDAMYRDMVSLGAPMSFQTSTWERIANPNNGETRHTGLVNTLNKVIGWGAHAVEMPRGHDLSGAELSAFSALLDANA